jgi:EmrB/QacA subfamily drug resistance transporter
MDRRRGLALAVLCLASFMAVADSTIVSIALPAMRRELGFSGADAQWVLNGYALAFGGLLLVCGRAGDLYGRRLLFLAGLGVFGAVSLLGGFAQSPGVLVLARFLQGAAAAAFVPASLSLLTTIFEEGEERNRAIGIYGTTAALGFVVGMVGGGILTELLGWRWVLFVNVPVALVALLAAPAAIPESRIAGSPPSLDALGALTATAGLAATIYAVSEVPERGWTSATTLLSAALGLSLLVLFVATERRARAPLVPLSVFRDGAVTVPNAAIFLQSTVGVAWLYLMSLYFQDVLGYGPLAAGLLFLPMALASVAAAAVAGRLATRLGTGKTAALGLGGVVAGLLLMMGVSREGGLLVVLAGTVVGEAGFMFSNVSLTIAGTGATGEDGRGLAAGLLNTSVQLGNAWGLGVVATLVAATVGPLAGGLEAGLLACAGFALLAVPLAFFGLPAGKPPEVGDDGA